MTAPAIPDPSRRPVPRYVALLAVLAALVGATLVGPAIVAPSYTDPASAAVYSSCTISRCADARTARAGWSDRGFPTSRGWYSWTGGKYNFAGGKFGNYEGQLPAGGNYYEYDVYPRNKGAARDAYRIVVDKANGATWFSPNHYTDFYRL